MLFTWHASTKILNVVVFEGCQIMYHGAIYGIGGGTGHHFPKEILGIAGGFLRCYELL